MANSKRHGDTQKENDDPCDDWSKQPLPDKEEKQQ